MQERTFGHKLFKAAEAPAIISITGYALMNTRHWIREKRNENFPTFHDKLDTYVMFAPDLAVYAMDIAGVKGKHSVGNQTAIFLKSELLMYLMVEPLKRITHITRPDGSDNKSFPSGHTAQAFAAATFLHREFGHKSIWISIGGYTVATAIGASRILNNRHWITDVMVGAGVGILSTNLIYLTHQNKWGRKKNGNHATLIPTYNQGAGMYFSYTFK